MEVSLQFQKISIRMIHAAIHVMILTVLDVRIKKMRQIKELMPIIFILSAFFIALGIFNILIFIFEE